MSELGQTTIERQQQLESLLQQYYDWVEQTLAIPGDKTLTMEEAQEVFNRINDLRPRAKAALQHERTDGDSTQSRPTQALKEVQCLLLSALPIQKVEGEYNYVPLLHNTGVALAVISKVLREEESDEGNNHQ